MQSKKSKLTLAGWQRAWTIPDRSVELAAEAEVYRAAKALATALILHASAVAYSVAGDAVSLPSGAKSRTGKARTRGPH